MTLSFHFRIYSSSVAITAAWFLTQSSNSHSLTFYVILDFGTHFISRTTNVNHRLENKSSNNVTSRADEAEIEAALSKMYDEIKLQSLPYSYSNYD